MEASKVNIMSLWSVVIATLTASLWLFANIAWAADIERIESRLIKRDLRDLRAELVVAQAENREKAIELLEEDIQDAIDALCDIKPEDRECKK